MVGSADCSLIPHELILRDTFNSSGRLAGGEVLLASFLLSEGDKELSDITFTSGEWCVSGGEDRWCGTELGDVSCEALEDLVSLRIECSSSDSSDSLSDLESNSSTSESSPNSSVSGCGASWTRGVETRPGEMLLSSPESWLFSVSGCSRVTMICGGGVEGVELVELELELSDSLPELSTSESDRCSFGRFRFCGEISLSSSESSSEERLGCFVASTASASVGISVSSFSEPLSSSSSSSSSN